MSYVHPHSPSELQIERALLERSASMDCFDVFVVTGRVRGRSVDTLLPLAPPVIQTTPVGDYIERKPAFRLGSESAQALLDGLWAAGIRPSSGQGAADVGVVKAMEEHIKDLRIAAGLTPRHPDVPLTPGGEF